MGAEVVVITGAAGRVGAQTARAFAQGGARIGLVDAGADALTAVGREVERLGGEALVLPCDVADAEALEAAADAVEEHFGAIDIWVNAGIDRVEDTVGAVHGTFTALKRMKARDEGSIVQVALAARRAVDGLTDALRTELLHAGSGVRVSAVHVDNVARIVDVARHPRKSFLVGGLFSHRPPPAPRVPARPRPSRAARIAALAAVVGGLLLLRRLRRRR